jgi:hypothetical protein
MACNLLRRYEDSVLVGEDVETESPVQLVLSVSRNKRDLGQAEPIEHLLHRGPEVAFQPSIIPSGNVTEETAPDGPIRE